MQDVVEHDKSQNGEERKKGGEETFETVLVPGKKVSWTLEVMWGGSTIAPQGLPF